MEIEEIQYIEKYLIYGLIGMLVLLLFIITLIVMYNKRAILHKEDLYRNQLDYKDKLLKQSLIIEEMAMDNIAKNLHDDVGAYLSLIHMNIEYYRKTHNINDEKFNEFIEKQKEYIGHISSSIRWAVSNLRTPALKKFGLQRSLENLILNIIESSEIDIQFEVNEIKIENLSDFEEVQLYRIISELLNNLIKHAKPKQASLNLICENNELVFNLTHDGNGISNDEFLILSNKNKGIGLQSIITRVKAIKANIYFDKKETTSSIVLRFKK